MNFSIAATLSSIDTRIFFYKKPSEGPGSISFLFQVQILVLKVS